MAVTVTNAAPPTALAGRNEDGNNLPSAFVGTGYGPSGGASAASPAIVWDTTGSAIRQGRVKIVELQLSGTYATGGFGLTPSAYGLKEINSMAVIADNSTGTGGPGTLLMNTAGESPNVKILTAPATELTNGTSVASVVYDVILVGW